jgi:hypothetical protein
MQAMTLQKIRQSMSPVHSNHITVNNSLTCPDYLDIEPAFQRTSYDNDDNPVITDVTSTQKHSHQVADIPSQQNETYKLLEIDTSIVDESNINVSAMFSGTLVITPEI